MIYFFSSFLFLLLDNLFQLSNFLISIWPQVKFQSKLWQKVGKGTSIKVRSSERANQVIKRTVCLQYWNLWHKTAVIYSKK